jgi:2-polyprenyl-3-methyl-5-hydroxy-6-metoxy-1,4-benzoquinol methylase
MPDNPKTLSFRDPAGHVVIVNGEIYRAIHASFKEQVSLMLELSWIKIRFVRGHLPRTVWCPRPLGCEKWGEEWSWLKHHTLELPLYPHEITMQQLYESALLTLELAEDDINAGYLMKDASAWNVLHEAGRPVFVDLTSFVPNDGNPLWVAYAQFGRHFIIPLLLALHLRMNTREIFVLNREGVSPERAFSLLGKLRSASSLVALEFILLPVIVGKFVTKANASQPKQEINNADSVKRSHATLIARLRHYVKGLNPSRVNRQNSLWSKYTITRDHYSAEAVVQKHSFIVRALESGKGKVLDLGCNTGEYALVAARFGRVVVAADVDERSLQLLHCAKEDLPISALMLDLANPSPGLGWRNREVSEILTRLTDKFDTILCVGLLHHLLVTARVPINEIINLFTSLHSKEIVVEWISPNDPMFGALAGPNMDLYRGLNHELFKELMSNNWDLVESEQIINSTRYLYVFRRRSSIDL